MTADRGSADRDVVLVSWVSVHHRAAPLLTAIHDPESPLGSRVHTLYLCWRDAPSPGGDLERRALRETVEELGAGLDRGCPDIVELPWKSREAPTDHGAIRPFAEETLKRVRDENPERVVAIHLSPGTPAMHAVWLVLGTTGFVPGPLMLLQTSDERARAEGQSAVQPVELDLDTWLRRYRSARPQNVGSADDGHAWDPTRVKSPALRSALEKLEEWAPLRVPVLLVGERGTGKTTLANFLRAMSPFQRTERREWPTVVCGQYRANPELARSELFGHVRGAFTGATADRRGLLEQADGDTLFFDEIADLDRDTQRLLMAAIEGRGFQRLGETELRQSAFRLVCATNRALADLRRDVLDRDFFDRIAVCVLSVPPLRQCGEDLPDAWRRVLVDATEIAGVKPDRWDSFIDHPKLLTAIRRHPLHGNFRDLQRAAIHLLAALQANRAEERIVETAISSLGPHDSSPNSVPAAEDLVQHLPLDDLRAHLEAVKGAWLRAALTPASGNVSEAARLVGLPRKTFEHWMRKLD